MIWPEVVPENQAVHLRQSGFERGASNSSASTGMVSDQPLNTWGTPVQTTVSNVSVTIAAAGTGQAGRIVIVKLPTTAANGMFINLNGASTSSHFLVEPGEVYVFATNNAITAIRNGVDVTAHTMIGSV